MDAMQGQSPSTHPPLPPEIAGALKRADTARLYNELKEDSIFTGEELERYLTTCTAFLEKIWFNADFDEFRFLVSSVTPDRTKAAWWKMESLVITPLLEGLRESGMGNDAILFQQKNFVLTPARMNSHTTDRITVKRHDVVERKSLFRKPTVLHTFELDVAYPEKGRWGDYETDTVRCKSDEEARCFIEAFAKARMVGNLNAFLAWTRHFL